MAEYQRRSPQGERGLKLGVYVVDAHVVGLSLSARRAWIEIAQSAAEAAKTAVALRKESVD